MILILEKKNIAFSVLLFKVHDYLISNNYGMHGSHVNRFHVDSWDIKQGSLAVEFRRQF